MAKNEYENLQHGSYCLSCGHIVTPKEGESVCPRCGGGLTSMPTPEEAKAFSVKVHGDRTTAKEKYNTAMCFVVLGTIALILGILFMILSMQRVRNQIVGVNPASFQFVISIICLVLGGAALGYGLFVVIKALKTISQANREIIAVGRLYSVKKPKKE